MNSLVFEQWLSKFKLGWIPIAIFRGKQIFKVTDFREKCRYIFVMADSRKEVMEWIIDSGNNFLIRNNFSEKSSIKWFTCKKANRGKVSESFEIVRLLESEIPQKSFPIYSTIGGISFKTLLENHLPQRKRKNFKKKIFRFSNSILFSQNISQLKKGWSWDFNEAVFQTGIFLKEFERMYLLRCLYRREKLNKKFLGWKIHLIRNTEDSEDLENPFWNVSNREEQNLEKFLQRTDFLPEKISKYMNTPDKERKRRYDFQKKCKFYIRR